MKKSELAEMLLDSITYYDRHYADSCCRYCHQLISRGEQHKNDCTYHELLKISEGEE